METIKNFNERLEKYFVPRYHIVEYGEYTQDLEATDLEIYRIWGRCTDLSKMTKETFDWCYNNLKEVDGLDYDTFKLICNLCPQYVGKRYTKEFEEQDKVLREKYYSSMPIIMTKEIFDSFCIDAINLGLDPEKDTPLYYRYPWFVERKVDNRNLSKKHSKSHSKKKKKK